MAKKGRFGIFWRLIAEKVKAMAMFSLFVRVNTLLGFTRAKLGVFTIPS